jgi:RNA methyltransferase, TrmH family
MRVLSVARDLRRRHARERHGLFVAEGVRAVEDLLRSQLTLRGVLVATPVPPNGRATSLLAAIHERGIALQQVSADDFASASETDTPQGILAIAEVPRLTFASLPSIESFRLVVLDAIQDPGNAGTIVRTAAALGAAATVALPGTVDLWNAKVVRSSMGAHFHHPAFACTWSELMTFLSDRDATLWGTDARGEPLESIVERRSEVPRRLAVAVGNEGGGLSIQTRDRAEKLVALPIGTAVESLNVAVATGIILYELRS